VTGAASDCTDKLILPGADPGACLRARDTGALDDVAWMAKSAMVGLVDKEPGAAETVIMDWTIALTVVSDRVTGSISPGMRIRETLTLIAAWLVCKVNDCDVVKTPYIAEKVVTASTVWAVTLMPETFIGLNGPFKLRSPRLVVKTVFCRPIV